MWNRGKVRARELPTCQPEGALMPSIPFAFLQVVSSTFASFRVVQSNVSAAQADFCSGFNSRQLQLRLRDDGRSLRGRGCADRNNRGRGAFAPRRTACAGWAAVTRIPCKECELNAAGPIGEPTARIARITGLGGRARRRRGRLWIRQLMRVSLNGNEITSGLLIPQAPLGPLVSSMPAKMSDWV